MAPGVLALLQKRYRRDFSIMLLKAFPIEHEGEVCDGSPLEDAFDRRRRAMQRLYARKLSMRPFPGDLGEEGWMWRPLCDGVPEPTA